MIDWTKVVTGAAMALPMAALLFLCAGALAKESGVPFFVFAKLVLAFVVGVPLLFWVANMAAKGIVMILEAFQ